MYVHKMVIKCRTYGDVFFKRYIRCQQKTFQIERSTYHTVHVAMHVRVLFLFYSNFSRSQGALVVPKTSVLMLQCTFLNMLPKKCGGGGNSFKFQFSIRKSRKNCFLREKVLGAAPPLFDSTCMCLLNEVLRLFCIIQLLVYYTCMMLETRKPKTRADFEHHDGKYNPSLSS